MPLQVTIIRVLEDTLPGPSGTFKPALRVEFKVGDHGPFIERVEKAGFNAATLNASLQAFAQQLALIGAK